jgi:hypothetical protein
VPAEPAPLPAVSPLAVALPEPAEPLPEPAVALPEPAAPLPVESVDPAVPPPGVTVEPEPAVPLPLPPIALPEPALPEPAAPVAEPADPLAEPAEPLPEDALVSVVPVPPDADGVAPGALGELGELAPVPSVALRSQAPSPARPTTDNASTSCFTRFIIGQPPASNTRKQRA